MEDKKEATQPVDNACDEAADQIVEDVKKKKKGFGEDKAKALKEAYDKLAADMKEKEDKYLRLAAEYDTIYKYFYVY